MSLQELFAALTSKGLYLATAESLTGGLVGAAITDEPGASKVYLGGVTAYTSQIKSQFLGVSQALLENQGAVDAEVAAQMAEGVRQKFSTKAGISTEKVIGLATTGVAGPDVQDGKAVGTVFLAIAGIPGVGAVVYEHSFAGDRKSIRNQSVAALLQHLREQIMD